MKLNTKQKQAVTSAARFTVVIAGPGSGKTATLIERIKHRVAQGIDPAKMVLLTFTNAGACEMAKRLAALNIEPSYVGTLHGFCFRLLQKYGHLIGYREGGITLCSEEDATEMLKGVMKNLGTKLSLKKLNELKTHSTGEAALVWGEFRAQLKRNNMVDYDRVLTAADALLGSSYSQGAIKQEPWFGGELYVDEVNDSSEIDWLIYEKFPASIKFFVGDPDQTIYGFRGARPDILLKFCEQGF